jgi:hypothetical protein
MRYILLVFVLGLVGREATADDRAVADRFESAVRPVLYDRRVKSHGPENATGGLRLDSRAAMLTSSDKTGLFQKTS